MIEFANDAAKELADKCRALSAERKLDFDERLNYLGGFADHEGKGLTKCILYTDFSPLSFEFTMLKKDASGEYRRWFNGGLIYFGRGENGVGSPQFSVRLVTDTEGWSIHT